MISFVESWLDVEDLEPEEPPRHPVWRRWAIGIVAAVVALSLAGIQLWSVIDRGEPPIADNGLEICGFDYCAVQDAIRAEGLGADMTRLASTYIGLEEAQTLTVALLDRQGEDPVVVRFVDRLDGLTSGQYSPGTRTISLEPPVRAWVVVHEVAHVMEGGHGDRFVRTLADLVRRNPDLFP